MAIIEQFDLQEFIDEFGPPTTPLGWTEINLEPDTLYRVQESKTFPGVAANITNRVKINGHGSQIELPPNISGIRLGLKTDESGNVSGQARFSASRSLIENLAISASARYSYGFGLLIQAAAVNIRQCYLQALGTGVSFWGSSAPAMLKVTTFEDKESTSSTWNWAGRLEAPYAKPTTGSRLFQNNLMESWIASTDQRNTAASFLWWDMENSRWVISTFEDRTRTLGPAIYELPVDISDIPYTQGETVPFKQGFSIHAKARARIMAALMQRAEFKAINGQLGRNIVTEPLYESVLRLADGTPLSHNANIGRADDIECHSCTQAGFHTKAEAGGGAFTAVRVFNVEGAGIDEDSFLGNHYAYPHVEGQAHEEQVNTGARAVPVKWAQYAYRVTSEANYGTYIGGYLEGNLLTQFSNFTTVLGGNLVGHTVEGSRVGYGKKSHLMFGETDYAWIEIPSAGAVENAGIRVHKSEGTYDAKRPLELTPHSAVEWFLRQ